MLFISSQILFTFSLLSVHYCSSIQMSNVFHESQKCWVDVDLVAVTVPGLMTSQTESNIILPLLMHLFLEINHQESELNTE